MLTASEVSPLLLFGHRKEMGARQLHTYSLFYASYSFLPVFFSDSLNAPVTST